MSALGYAIEKLGGGVQVLATHPGEIRERLIEAFYDSLHAVSGEALPEEAKRIWSQVMAKVTTAKGTPQSGVFQPSINALTDTDAVWVAQMIMRVDAMATSAFESLKLGLP